MELAYFGAQVLHPSAMAPCIDDSIPVYVRNIFNPAFPGTVIQGRSGSLTASQLWGAPPPEVQENASKEPLIKGITSIDDASLVTLEGALLADGAAGLGTRVLAALKTAGVSALMITQASSEASITVAVPATQGALARRAIEEAFELEFSPGRRYPNCTAPSRRGVFLCAAWSGRLLLTSSAKLLAKFESGP